VAGLWRQRRAESLRFRVFPRERNGITPTVPSSVIENARLKRLKCIAR